MGGKYMKESRKAKEILDKSISAAIARKHNKVKSIYLKIGTASSCMEPGVKMYFERFSKGTIAENVNFIVKEVRAKLRCPRCEKEFVRIPGDYTCPVCFAQGEPCEIGTELKIEKIETE